MATSYTYTALCSLNPGRIEEKKNIVAVVSAIIYSLDEDELFLELRDSSGHVDATLMSPGIGLWKVAIGDIVRIHRAYVTLEHRKKTVVARKNYANCSVAVFAPQEEASTALKHCNFDSVSLRSPFVELFAKLVFRARQLVAAPSDVQTAGPSTSQPRHGEIAQQSQRRSGSGVQDQSRTASLESTASSASVDQGNVASESQLQECIPLKDFGPRRYSDLVVEVLGIFHTVQNSTRLRCWDGGKLCEKMVRIQAGGKNETLKLVPDRDIKQWISRATDPVYNASEGRRVDVLVYGPHKVSLNKCRAGDIVLLGNINYAMSVHSPRYAYLVMNDNYYPGKKLVRLVGCDKGLAVKQVCRATVEQYCDEHGIDHAKIDEIQENADPVGSYASAVQALPEDNKESTSTLARCPIRLAYPMADSPCEGASESSGRALSKRLSEESAEGRPSKKSRSTLFGDDSIVPDTEAQNSLSVSTATAQVEVPPQPSTSVAITFQGHEEGGEVGKATNLFLEKGGALLEELQTFLLRSKCQHFILKLHKKVAENPSVSWDQEACVVSEMNVGEMCCLSNFVVAYPDRMDNPWKDYALVWCLECSKCSHIENVERNCPPKFCPACFLRENVLNPMGLTFRVNIPVLFHQNDRKRFIELRIPQGVFSAADHENKLLATESLKFLSEVEEGTYKTKLNEILDRVKVLSGSWSFLPMKSKVRAQFPSNCATATVLDVLDCRAKELSDSR